jgi:pilus assembly protein CpaE
MQRTPKILIVSDDSRLESEVAAALKGVPNTEAVLHYVPELRQGIEVARNRRPDFAFVEMSQDLRSLKVFAEEVSRFSPETTLAAVFAPDIFGPDVSESAIIIEAIRAGMQDFLRRPLSRADVEQLLERFYRKSAAPIAARAGKIIAFISNKGGVGKSTVAVNVACALAQRHPEQVLLVDASLQLGVCSSLLDVKPATSLTDAVQQRDRLDETLLRQLAMPHASGLALLAAPADAVEAAYVTDEIMARILTLARRAYDYVVVDTFPMLDQITVALLDLTDRAYVITDAIVPTVLGAAQLLRVLDNLGFPPDRQRIILNRYTGGADNLKPGDVAARLGRDIDHVLPYQRKLLIAANVGKPYILSASRWWGFGRQLMPLVAELEQLRPQGRAARELGRESEAAPHPAAPAAPSTNGTASPQGVLRREP